MAVAATGGLIRSLSYNYSHEVYRIYFLQYWTFILLTPVGMILVMMYALSDNVGYGVFVSLQVAIL